MADRALPIRLSATASGAASLRVAMLTHSVNPRGGVVHALALSEQLQSLGHDVTLFAPDPRGQGLFRNSRCRFQGLDAPVRASGIVERVRQGIDAYVRYFSAPDTPRFDIYHAQDAISANALADLVARGTIPAYIRTVHHLDDFADPQLAAWQERGYRQAAQCLCVSRTWQERLAREHGVAAKCVGNGVDTRRYSPEPAGRDDAVRQRYRLTGAPVFLTVGGVESRKNTLTLIDAFSKVRSVLPRAQLVIAGGASLLDHAAYRNACQDLLAARGLMPSREWDNVQAGEQAGAAAPLGVVEQPVVITGTVADDDMSSLYRCADAFVFPSLKEGFGLVVLEAMASGLPVVVSDIAPFTEYLDRETCAWVDPHDSNGMARAMCDVIASPRRNALIDAGARRAADFSWEASAIRHDNLYRRYLETNRKQEMLDA